MNPSILRRSTWPRYISRIRFVNHASFVGASGPFSIRRVAWVLSTRQWGCIANERQSDIRKRPRLYRVFDVLESRATSLAAHGTKHQQCASGRTVSLTDVEPIIASSPSRRGHRAYMREECRLHTIDIEFQALLYPT
ncbi:hypothetical protein DAEQUDRAFT_728591 [Daedalea quercina L-15889]|uniref:Uncharacterized protein n=1 Tax=Daedalea quercina L-15889 TaxID=1314783 RepID=A0A165P6H7_9APHY|nr:hypothetical protein DAEQUDRAFT_728591 [Daedalea quercina L-15889]